MKLDIDFTFDQSTEEDNEGVINTTVFQNQRSLRADLTSIVMIMMPKNDRRILNWLNTSRVTLITIKILKYPFYEPWGTPWGTRKSRGQNGMLTMDWNMSWRCRAVKFPRLCWQPLKVLCIKYLDIQVCKYAFCRLISFFVYVRKWVESVKSKNCRIKSVKQPISKIKETSNRRIGNQLIFPTKKITKEFFWINQSININETTDMYAS